MKDLRPDWLSQSQYPFALRSFDLPGGSVTYVDEGNGPALLFVNAGIWSFVFRDVIERLRSTYRCITLDFPGFGLSPAPDRELTPREMSTLLGEFVDALELRDFTIVAHDMGGPVSLVMANHRADRIGGLVLANTFAWTPDSFGPADHLPDHRWTVHDRFQQRHQSHDASLGDQVRRRTSSGWFRTGRLPGPVPGSGPSPAVPPNNPLCLSRSRFHGRGRGRSPGSSQPPARSHRVRREERSVRIPGTARGYLSRPPGCRRRRRQPLPDDGRPRPVRPVGGELAHRPGHERPQDALNGSA